MDEHDLLYAGGDEQIRIDSEAEPPLDDQIIAEADTDPAIAGANMDPAEDLEALQELLFGPYLQRARDLEVKISDMEAEIVDLERTINDKQALIDTMTPIVASSIRQSIRDSKEEMIDALYPIMGRLVTRAVGESMRELVQRIDTQMRNAFSMAMITRRMRARTMGVSEAELALREALPFSVDEVFLIHRETGILLRHASATPAESNDPDLISGMLTAIRDFVQDAFGSGDEEELDEIQYGGASVLIEAAQYSYVAVVTEGFVPQGFRARIRELLYQIEALMGPTLRNFDGDTAVFESIDALLAELFPIPNDGATGETIDAAVSASPVTSPRSQQDVGRLLLAAFMIILGTILLGWLLWEIGGALFSGAYPANAQGVLLATLPGRFGVEEGWGANQFGVKETYGDDQ